jgi:hypothetical protein
MCPAIGSFRLVDLAERHGSDQHPMAIEKRQIGCNDQARLAQ